MAMTDPIADLLTRVRNATRERHEAVTVPASRIKANIVRVLKEEGYVRNFRLMRNEEGHPVIRISLKYGDKGESAIQGIRRVSRPGLRIYSGHEDISRPLSGLGIAVVSTPAGVISGATARSRRLGGEVLCEVW